MHPELHTFLRQLAGVILATLVPVVLTAFVSMPMQLGQHPGEAGPAGARTVIHMT
jgi:hypothetical protein